MCWFVLRCAVLCWFVLCCAALCCAVFCCVVMCCAVMCCADLCCVVLCCVFLRCDVLCCAVLICVVLCCVVLHCVMLCCAVLCWFVLCCAVLCCADLRFVMLCCVRPCSMYIYQGNVFWAAYCLLSRDSQLSECWVTRSIACFDFFIAGWKLVASGRSCDRAAMSAVSVSSLVLVQILCSNSNSTFHDSRQRSYCTPLNFITRPVPGAA